MKLQPLMTWGQVKAALEAGGLHDDMHILYIDITHPRNATDLLVLPTERGAGIIDLNADITAAKESA